MTGARYLTCGSSHSVCISSYINGLSQLHLQRYLCYVRTIKLTGVSAGVSAGACVQIHREVSEV